MVSSRYVIESQIHTKDYYNNTKYTYFTKYQNSYIEESATPFVKCWLGHLNDIFPGHIRNEE